MWNGNGCLLGCDILARMNLLFNMMVRWTTASLWTVSNSLPCQSRIKGSYNNSKNGQIGYSWYTAQWWDISSQPLVRTCYWCRAERAHESFTSDFIHRIYSHEGKNVFTTKFNIIGEIQEVSVSFLPELTVRHKWVCFSITNWCIDVMCCKDVTTRNTGNFSMTAVIYHEAKQFNNYYNH